MTDEFLLKKWDYVFDHFFDLDRSKTLEWDDMEKLSEMVKEKRGENSKEHKVAAESMKVIWDGLLSYDMDGDQKVTKEEWHLMWQSILDGKPASQAWQDVYKKFTFTLLDATGDGGIDSKEYAEVMGYFGIKEPDAERSFDTFGVGQIKEDQFSELWKEFFMSTDKGAKGNRLFGEIK